MRLLSLEDGKLALTNFIGQSIPAYAILSHRWTDDEVLFDHVATDDIDETSAGWRKIEFCADRAAADGLKYFWCDTCCIDRWNKTELTRTVNAMFKYYRDAAKCYVYLQLPDAWVSAATTTHEPVSFDETELRRNEWFKRGWTLQELIAPKVVEFYDPQGRKLGDRTSYRDVIHEITTIPLEALDGQLDLFSREDRMKWAEGRITTEPEDAAYCLLGILDVQMPLTYGEGKDKALKRLRRELEADTKPPSLIPYSRKDCTIGHDALLAEMMSKLFGTPGDRIVTLVGEGGLGKSHLALEFAYSVQESRPDCSIFWCNASNLESLNQSYTDIALKLHIAGDQDQPDNVRSALRSYIGSKRAGEWLLIYDNADELDVTRAALDLHELDSVQQGLQLGPSTGHILVTTRDSEVANAVPGASIRMPELPIEGSTAMFKAYVGSSAYGNANTTAMTKFTRMPRDPLAIILMAAYIRARNISVEQYASELETFVARKSHGVASETTTATVATDQSLDDVIGLSLEWLTSKSPNAVTCLYEMACLHQTDIPIAFVRAGHGDDTEGILATLESYALSTRCPASAAVDIHSLVHSIVRERLQETDVWSRCVDRAQQALLETFPDVDERTRSHWRRLLPHTHYIFAYSTEEESSALARLRYKCGIALMFDGRYQEAEKLQTRVLDTLEGQKQPSNSTLGDLANLAANLSRQGRWKEAEELETQIWEIRRNDTGHSRLIEKLKSGNNLATTRQKRGRYKEAEELLLEALRESKEVLGLDHSCTITIMGNLAVIFENQGRWGEAEELQAQVLATSKSVLGHDHPDTLSSMANLAAVYILQGKIDAAEALLRRALAMGKTVLGPDHPNTMTTSNRLARALIGQGRFSEAAELLSKVLPTSMRVLGSDHSHTLSIVNNLGLSLKGLNQWQEAEEVLLQLIETSRRILGYKHLSTLNASNNLGLIYMSQGRLKEAEELMLEILETGKEVVGSRHPAVVNFMVNLTEAVNNQGRWSEACDLQEQALGICREVFGPRHWRTINLMEKLGASKVSLGRWEEAKEVLLEVLDVRKEVLGDNHSLTVDVKDTLAEIYRSRGREEEAVLL